jgi:menaquinone-specific isochorismate synthase
VVLARRVEIDCSSTIDPIDLCRSIDSPGRTIFIIQPTAQSAFLGASPEILYQRQGRSIACDALAGTRPIHRKDELLQSEKDLHEFRIVRNRIVDALSDLCQMSPTSSPHTIRSTPQVGHLYSQINAILKDRITDDALLNALHPTPAVGGHPTREALSFIRKREPFERGLYAAPIGWMSRAKAEFAVGIRSCLIQKKRAYLYAGTGIVEGSDPKLEWDETEHKLSEWKRIFHG